MSANANASTKDRPTPTPTRLWTFADHTAGLCTLAEINTPWVERAPEPEPESTPPPTHPHNTPGLPDMSSMTDAEIANTAVRLLRESTVEVFHRIGGADWLYQLARTDPKNFLKMLQRLLPQSIEATVAVTSFEVPRHIRELSLAELKAMRASPAADILDVPSRMVK